MQTNQTPVFFRKARWWIKRLVLATLAFMVLAISFTSFLFSKWGQPWLLQVLQRALTQQESLSIDFREMKVSNRSLITIAELTVRDLQGKPLLEIDSLRLHFSILQLLHASLPLERVEVPHLTLYPDHLDAFFKTKAATGSTHKKMGSPFDIDIPLWMLSAHMRLNIEQISLTGTSINPLSLYSLIRWNPLQRYVELDMLERTPLGNQPQLQLRASQFLRRAAIEVCGLQLHRSSLLSTSLQEAWPGSSFLLELEGSLEDWSQSNEESEFPARLEGNLKATIDAPEELFQGLQASGHKRQLPSTLRLHSNFNVENHWKVISERLELQGWGLQTSGKAEIDLPESSFKLAMSGPFHPARTLTPGMDWHTTDLQLDISGKRDHWSGSFELQAPQLDLTSWDEPLTQASAKAAIRYHASEGLEISGNVQAIYENKPIHIDLVSAREGDQWKIKHLQAGSEGMDLSIQAATGEEEPGWYLRATMGLEPSLISQILQKRLNLQAGAMELFAHWASESTLNSVKANAGPHLTNVDFDMKLQELSWDSWRVQSGSATGRVRLDDDNLNDFILESFNLQASHIEQDEQLICKRLQSHGWGNANAIFFQLHAARQSQFEGSDIPYDLSSEGLLAWKKGALSLSLEDLKGSWSGLPLEMKQSTFFEISPHKLTCTGLNLDLGGGKLEVAGHFLEEEIRLKAFYSKVPVNMISLLIGRPLWGEASGSLSVDVNAERSEGQVSLQLSGLRTENGASPTSEIQGLLTGYWKGPQLRFDASLYNSRESLKGSVNGQWQALIRPQSWSSLGLDESHEASVSLEGKLGLFSHLFTDEDLDFDGQASLQFHTKGSIRTPIVEGQAQVLAGSFDHYGIGLKIRDIACQLHGEDHEIVLDHLSANDGAHGKLEATGRLYLEGDLRSASKLQLNKFQFIQIPLTQALATGDGYFNHHGLSARLGGQFSLEKASIQIPDLLPGSVPEFKDYTIVRKPGKRTISPAWLTPSLAEDATGKSPEFIPKVVSFDLDLLVPSGLTLKGRGLHSTWEGEVKLLGHSEQTRLLGQMKLQEGEFRFGGRRFIVNEGEVDFSGQPLDGTQIRVASEAIVDQVTIRATLVGPLTQPRLQFNATPHLSLADLFSHLLFGKSYNSLSPFQGLQVAQLALETSGTANTDAFTHLRKKTGVDRFDIATKKPGTAETTTEDVYAVKLGKYVADGFLIGINKNVSAEGTQLTLELDLTKHLSLITEIGYLDDSSLNLMWKKEY